MSAAWPSVRLEEIAESQYGTSEKANEQGLGLPILRMGNLTDQGSFELTDLKHIELSGSDVERYTVRQGDLLFNRTNSPELVGKMGLWSREDNFSFAGYLVRVRITSRHVWPAFVAAYFNTPAIKKILRARAKPSINMSNISASELMKMPLPLPPLDEQRRIAAILDQAEALRAKRRQALNCFDGLEENLFREMFGDPVINSKSWRESFVLGDVAEIVSGVTKGRKLGDAATRSVPYLAVANVQERALKLDNVKHIDATEEEIHRYRLVKGDLLLTEGGDPDKLGRGTLWGGELPECIHQNHIFRVRVKEPQLHPLFLSRLVASARGKRYFLKAAKQTTGIASINMTQLRGFPLLVPPLSLQREFAAQVAAVERLKAAQRASLAALDELFASLQHRAFRGELTPQKTQLSLPLR